MDCCSQLPLVQQFAQLPLLIPSLPFTFLNSAEDSLRLAAIANALSALLKGALLALELLGSYDAEK